MKRINRILLLCFIVLITLTGITYAWYMWQGADVQVNVNFAGLDPYIRYTATTITSDSGITPSDTYSEGISNNITFNKETAGSELQVYGHLYLEISSSSSEEVFKASNLKWTLVSVTNSIETEISTGNFVGELVNNKIPAYINFPLNPNSDTTYKVYIWIDKNAPLNRDISKESISVNIYSEASSIGSNNEGKYKELYIREIIYQNSVINTINLYSSMYEITDYLITNTTDIPSVSSSDWNSITSTTSSTEPGYIASINNINHTMNEINNICIKNSNGDIYCKSIGNYVDSVNLTYDCTTNGGSTENTTELVAYNSSADLSKTCSKSGWTFVGWNSNSDATTKLDSYTVPATNTTLYAIYRKEAVTLTAKWNANGATLSSIDDSTCTLEAVYNNNTQATSCTLTAPTITRDGYTIVGFDTSASSTSNNSSYNTSSKLLTVTTSNTGTTWYAITYTSLSSNFYYYNGSSHTSTTASCTVYNTDSLCTYTLPTIVSSSIGPNSSTYYGVSTATSSSSITTTYNSSTSNYYAVYQDKLTASYTKDSGVASIGSTSNSCNNYQVSNGSAYSATSCSVTLPSITASDGFVALGWYNSSSTKVGDANTSITLTSNQTFTAKARNLTASELSYDNTNTGEDCSDAQCMIDTMDSLVESK